MARKYKDEGARSRSFSSNDIRTLLESITDEVDNLENWPVTAISIHREAADAYFGTVIYDKSKDANGRQI